ncbi:hypothetical protein [Sulfuricaulis sp.]
MDKVADVLVVFVIVVVLIGAIYLFWKLRVLPDAIVEMRYRAGARCH